MRRPLAAVWIIDWGPGPVEQTRGSPPPSYLGRHDILEWDGRHRCNQHVAVVRGVGTPCPVRLLGTLGPADTRPASTGRPRRRLRERVLVVFTAVDLLGGTGWWTKLSGLSSDSRTVPPAESVAVSRKSDAELACPETSGRGRHVRRCQGRASVGGAHWDLQVGGSSVVSAATESDTGPRWRRGVDAGIPLGQQPISRDPRSQDPTGRREQRMRCSVKVTSRRGHHLLRLVLEQRVCRCYPPVSCSWRGGLPNRDGSAAS